MNTIDAEQFGKISYKTITTDSRAVFSPADTVFAAIRTDVNDGHKYIPSLIAMGVSTFIVEEIPAEAQSSDASFYVVASVPDTLRSLAAASLDGIRQGVIITGSRGKTKVKELIYRALLPLTEVYRSPRSWNSAIGVPLALLNRPRRDAPTTIITEIGIDGPGQAANYEWLVPSHKTGILTPMNEEHDEAFGGNHTCKLRQKVELVKNCRVIVYADTDPELNRLLEELHNEHPDIKLVPTPPCYHAIADAALAQMGYCAATTGISIVETRRSIRTVSYDNTLVRDNFSHDLRSLQDSLDFLRRNSTPAKESVLVLDNILHAPSTADKVRKIYCRAVEMAKGFGVKRIISISPEMNALGIDDDAVEHANVDEAFLNRCQNGDVLRNKQILLFGETGGSVEKIDLALEQADHDTTLAIDLDALVHNYNLYRRMLPAGTGMVGMVKASAYGTGAIEVGKTLQSIGAAYLAVAVVDEGVSLREAGIDMDIMVLNPVTNRYPALFGHRLQPAVFSLDELNRLIAEAEAAGVKDYPVHIKLDTGMHRVGFLAEHLDGIARCLADTNRVRIASVFSHLATADCLDKDSYTLHQIEQFYSLTEALREKIGYDFKRHILNTAGMMRFADCGPYEMARLGIGLYGISPYSSANPLPLRPVASLSTRIISLKHWPADTPIGYGCRGITERDSIIATIPVGYADGINRHFGRGHASFVVNGTKCPTIGNICMDLCMIDVTDAPEVAVGDKVEIFGPDKPIEELAQVLDTIPYEILTSVSPRVRRTYYRH